MKQINPEWPRTLMPVQGAVAAVEDAAVARHPGRSGRVSAAVQRYRWDLLRFCLSALIVFSVSRIHQRYGFLSALRPGLLLTALALLAAFMNHRVLADGRWMKGWPARVVAGLSITAIGSIPFGISAGGSWWMFSNYYWKVLVVCFLLMAAIRNVNDLRRFVWAYVVGTAILVWMALFVFQMVAERNGVTRLSNLDTWDANDVCVLLLIALPLCLLLIRTSQLRGRLFASVLLLGIGAVIARSGSRGGFLGLAVVLFAYLLSMKGAAKLRGVAMVLVVGLTLTQAAPTGYWQQMSTITSVREDYNWDAAQGRRQLAIRGMQYMWSRPFFGVGIGNFGRAEGTISPLAGAKGVRWSAPHNSYVEAGAELGLSGLILFLGMVLGCIVAPWRMRKRIPAAWERGTPDERFLFQMAIYLPLATLGFAAPAYFVSFAFIDPIYTVTAMTGGFLLCAEAHLRGQSALRPVASVPPARGGPNRRGMPGGLRRTGPVQPAPRNPIAGSALTQFRRS